MEQTRLSEVLKRNKSFKRTIVEQNLYNSIVGQTVASEDEFIGLKGLLETKQIIDYQKDELKRRAQTISVAFNIAIKFLLSLQLTGTTQTYWNSFPYMLNPERLEELKTGNFDNDIIYNEMVKAIETVSKLDMLYVNVQRETFPLASFLSYLSNTAVMLAWLEVYYKTSFMPKDTQILDNQHPTHIDLCNEVNVLLSPTLQILKTELPFLTQGFVKTIEFDKEITDKTKEFIGTANILINDTILIEFKTTGKLPTTTTLQTDYHHAVGLTKLDPTISELYLCYVRFGVVTGVDLGE